MCTNISISSCLRPSRHCACDVRLVGRMADQLLGCWVPTSSRMGPKFTNSVAKSHQDVAQNPSKWRCWGVLGPSSGCLGGSWRALGGSWGHLGPKMAPRWPQEAQKPRKINSGAPSWEPSWRPKSIKNPSRGHRNGNRFFDHFGDRLGERFGANLAPTWLPKPSQNGAKLASKSMSIGV